MKTLDQLKGRCRIEDGDDGKEHWIYAGAETRGTPTIRCPDYTKDPTGKRQTVQYGPRAAIHLSTGKPIPAGKSAYRTCLYSQCVNPECMQAWTKVRHGKFLKSTERHVGQLHLRAGALKRWDGKRKITAEKVAHIQASNDSIYVVGDRLGLHPSGVARVRRGQHSLAMGIFTGLLRA